MSVQPPGKGLGMLIIVSGILLSGILTACVWYYRLAPLQTTYLPTYFATQYLPTTATLGLAPKPKRYTVLTVHSQDATLANMPSTMKSIGVRYIDTTPDRFAAWLRLAVFNGETGGALVATPLLVWGVLAFVSMIAGTLVSKRQKRKALEGIKLRGPDMMTVDQFNKVTKGDGFVLKVKA